MRRFFIDQVANENSNVHVVLNWVVHLRSVLSWNNYV